jgi:hypothetical protein
MQDFDSPDLSAKLRAWQVDPHLPAAFAREVWQRIAVRQAVRRDAFWPALGHAFLALLARPQYAIALVLLSVSAGLGFAHLHAQEVNARHWKALEARYATSVDPLSMAR